MMLSTSNISKKLLPDSSYPAVMILAYQKTNEISMIMMSIVKNQIPYQMLSIIATICNKPHRDDLVYIDYEMG